MNSGRQAFWLKSRGAYHVRVICQHTTSGAIGDEGLDGKQQQRAEPIRASKYHVSALHCMPSNFSFSSSFQNSCEDSQQHLQLPLLAPPHSPQPNPSASPPEPSAPIVIRLAPAAPYRLSPLRRPALCRAQQAGGNQNAAAAGAPCERGGSSVGGQRNGAEEEEKSVEAERCGVVEVGRRGRWSSGVVEVASERVGAAGLALLLACRGARLAGEEGSGGTEVARRVAQFCPTVGAGGGLVCRARTHRPCCSHPCGLDTVDAHCARLPPPRLALLQPTVPGEKGERGAGGGDGGGQGAGVSTGRRESEAVAMADVVTALSTRALGTGRKAGVSQHALLPPLREDIRVLAAGRGDLCPSPQLVSNPPQLRPISFPATDPDGLSQLPSPLSLHLLPQSPPPTAVMRGLMAIGATCTWCAVVRLSPAKNAALLPSPAAPAGAAPGSSGVTPLLCGAALPPHAVPSVEAVLHDVVGLAAPGAVVVDGFMGPERMRSFHLQPGSGAAVDAYFPLLTHTPPARSHHSIPHSVSLVTLLNIHPCLYDAYGMTVVEAAAFSAPSVIHVGPGGAVGAAELLSPEEQLALPVDLSAALPVVAESILALLRDRQHLAQVGLAARRRSLEWSEEASARALTAMLQRASV
ncbi:unnamed protein product [Closterium sp. NIES-65]|nr:unnamed protein product [Closterium sp. NIES-65]